MALPTSVQIVPGHMVLSGNVHTNDTSDTFCIDHTNGIVGIGQSLTNLVNDSNVLQISGGVHATRYYGDGSQITGLTDSKWLEDENDINDIYYSAGNVGIGGAAGTEKLTVHGDLNLDGGNLKLNGQTAVFSNWTSGTNSIYRLVGDVGIGISSPGEKLHVNGNLRLGSSSDDTVDDNSNRSISTAGQLSIKSNDSGVNNSYVNLILQSGKTNPGKIVIGGGDTDVYRDIEFYTSGSSDERMRIHHDGTVGIGTTTPGRKLEVYTGNGAHPGLRLRRYPTGATYTDFQHADSTSPANSKEGLAITVGDGNVTAQEVMRICGDGSVGINTTNPHRALDVQSPARPSTYPFAIGGSWSNRAEYVAKTYDPGTGGGSGYPTVDFLIGGGGQPGWARVMFAAWKPNNFPSYWGYVEISGIAEFTFGVEGTQFSAVREFGDGNISMSSSGSHNGGRITISQSSSPQSTWRIWYEIYHEDGVYW